MQPSPNCSETNSILFSRATIEDFCAKLHQNRYSYYVHGDATSWEVVCEFSEG